MFHLVGNLNLQHILLFSFYFDPCGNDNSNMLKIIDEKQYDKQSGEADRG